MPTDLEKKFLRDVAYGSLADVQNSLDDGVNVNAVDDQGNSALICVARTVNSMPKIEERVKIAKLLLARGADVNFKGEYDYTPLITAIRSYSSLEMVEAILDAKPDLEARDTFQSTAMNWAGAGTASVEVIHTMHRAGANINVANKYKSIPAMSAVYHGKTDFAQALIDCGANLLLKNEEGHTVIDLFNEHQAHNKELFAVIKPVYDAQLAVFEAAERVKLEEFLPRKFKFHLKPAGR